MVEAHAQSVDDYLIEGLSFKLGAGASYVTNRRSVSFFPSGSDTYSPASGVKVIKIKLNGNDWLDPNTVKFMFTLTNTDGTNDMTILSGPHNFLKRFKKHDFQKDQDFFLPKRYAGNGLVLFGIENQRKLKRKAKAKNKHKVNIYGALNVFG